MQTFWKGRTVVSQHSLDVVDDFDRRSRAGFVNAHEHATLAVGQDDVGLRGEAVAYVSNVLHVDGSAINGLDWKVVEFRNSLRASIHFHVVFERAEFRGAGGKDKVLRIHGVHDVDRGKPFGLQRDGIDIDADNALLASIGEWRGSPWHSGKLRANEVVAGVEELLFAERIAGQANLNDRHRRSRIDDH